MARSVEPHSVSRALGRAFNRDSQLFGVCSCWTMLFLGLAFTFGVLFPGKLSQLGDVCLAAEVEHNELVVSSYWHTGAWPFDSAELRNYSHGLALVEHGGELAIELKQHFPPAQWLEVLDGQDASLLAQVQCTTEPERIDLAGLALDRQRSYAVIGLGINRFNKEQQVLYIADVTAQLRAYLSSEVAAE